MSRIYREFSPELMENEIIREAIELLDESKYTPDELAAYDKYWDIISAEKSALAKGRAEGKAEVVLNAHKAGYSIETIATFTALTPEQITEILKNNS